MFHAADAKLVEPVRVYVGVRSADSAAARASLAVRELERAGGFDRKVLVVWTPTGTGWMVPKAATAIELLHRGDTAIVAIQYSFLPSLIAVFVDTGLAWRPPEWMAQPRGFDVPDSLRWFPIVSSVQSVGDFLDQLGPPPGFGHDYSTEYVNGWASVVPPEGWTDADTERLEQFIGNMAGDESEQR